MLISSISIHKMQQLICLWLSDYFIDTSKSKAISSPLKISQFKNDPNYLWIPSKKPSRKNKHKRNRNKKSFEISRIQNLSSSLQSILDSYEKADSDSSQGNTSSTYGSELDNSVSSISNISDSKNNEFCYIKPEIQVEIDFKK